MKKILIVIFIFILSKVSIGQELNCSIQVVAPTVEGTEKRVYETLQEALYEFMNSKRWTNYVFKMEERIECNILINIKEKISSDHFRASIQVQSRRPVYNTAYDSPVLNLKDDNLEFYYVEYQPLNYSENTFETNITSVLAYYAYIVIGFDFDTFSNMGGTEFFQTAQNIVNNAQNESFPGWKSYESMKNRYWLVENLLNNTYSPIRQAQYSYHLKGLDIMSENPDNARKEIIAALELIKKAHREKPGSYLMQIFFDAKSSEIVNIFSESASMEVSQVKNILNEVDPANADEYNQIGKQ